MPFGLLQWNIDIFILWYRVLKSYGGCIMHSSCRSTVEFKVNFYYGCWAFKRCFYTHPVILYILLLCQEAEIYTCSYFLLQKIMVGNFLLTNATAVVAIDHAITWTATTFFYGAIISFSCQLWADEYSKIHVLVFFLVCNVHYYSHYEYCHQQSICYL